MHHLHWWEIALAVVGLIFIYVVISMFPEMRRYWRMRRM